MLSKFFNWKLKDQSDDIKKYNDIKKKIDNSPDVNSKSCHMEFTNIIHNIGGKKCEDVNKLFNLMQKMCEDCDRN